MGEYIFNLFTLYSWAITHEEQMVISAQSNFIFVRSVTPVSATDPNC